MSTVAGPVVVKYSIGHDAAREIIPMQGTTGTMVERKA